MVSFPWTAKRRFGTAVASFWDGKLVFESARFNFFGDQHYKGVSFLDNKGRKWAYADTINATLGNWPSRNYYLRNVNIDKLTVQFLLDTDKETFPLKPAFFGSAPKDPTAVLQSVNINTGPVSVIRINGKKVYLGDIVFLAKRQEGIFKISTIINNAEMLDDIVFKGTLSKDYFELNNISGSFCNGKTKGSLRIDSDKSKSSYITGDIKLEEIDMAKLAIMANHADKITTGKARLEYFYEAEKLDLDTFSGHGSLFIDDADMLPIPLLTNISKTIVLPSGLTSTDIQVPVLVSNLIVRSGLSGNSLVDVLRVSFFSSFCCENAIRLDINNNAINKFCNFINLIISLVK